MAKSSTSTSANGRIDVTAVKKDAPMILMQSPVERVLAKLPDPRRNGDGWMARCPSHEDHQASLSIGTGEDGLVLVHCHAGCTAQAIVSAVGLHMSDLMPPRNGHQGNGHQRRARRSKAKKSATAPEPADSHVPCGASRAIASYARRRGWGKPADAWGYTDAAGKLVCIVARWDLDGGKEIRPFSLDNGRWKAKSMEPPRPIYDLPMVNAADASLLTIHGGEKATEAATSIGLPATTNAGGERAIDKTDWTPALRFDSVAIITDNDPAGERFGRDLASKLKSSKPDLRVKSLRVSDLPKGDMFDAVAAGMTKEQFLSQVEAVPEVTTESLRKKRPHFPLTDSGLAERFAHQHGENVRFCHPWGKWLIWDDRRWRIDDTGAVNLLSKETARSIYAEAAEIEDDAERKAVVAFAKNAESAVKRAAMLRLASSEPAIPILPDKLDANPWLLNAQNGTIDLQTATLHPARREDFVTKLAPVQFDPDADAPLWKTFLKRIFDGRQSLIDFVQRLAGYCLTGDVREQVLSIFFGGGANGKSTFLEMLLTTLGDDYSMKGTPDLLLAKKTQSHPTERADLFGKRLVACVESEDNRRLAESLTKELTGGDTIRARRMREDHWQFKPSHKIILATNHKPRIVGTDLAIWRRVRLVPFDITIPPEHQDKTLPLKMLNELPGILAWAVAGCLSWQQGGLGEPEEVTSATDAYRREEDSLADFLDQCCETDPAATVRAGDLYAVYKKHAELSGEYVMSQRKFGGRMSERGFERFKANGVWYKGLALLDPSTRGG